MGHAARFASFFNEPNVARPSGAADCPHPSRRVAADALLGIAWPAAHTVNPNAPRFEFRGCSKVWGKSFQANAAWFDSRCVITPEAITVRCLGREHLHRNGGLAALRWTWLPFPGFVVISRRGSECAWSGFGILGWSRLRSALSACGYSFTAESLWPPLWQYRQDIHDFALYDETR